MSSLWNRQQTAPIAYASIAGLLIIAGARALLFGSTGQRLLQAPEPTEKEPYPWSIYEGGATLKTPYGRLRLYEVGPKEGKKVLLIHGVSLPSPLWRRLIPKLVANGHRVLCFDLVARGYSDGPAHLDYDTSLYVSQICMLLTSLPEWSGSFNVVGYSLGGLIATTFASFFPHRVDNLLLIAPAGLAKSQSLSFFEQFFYQGKIPLSLAKAFVGVAPIRLMRSSPLVNWQLDNHQGLVHAFTSSLISNNFADLQDRFKEVHEQFGDRMQIIWGDQDVICPFEGAKTIPEIKVHVIEGAGHDMPLQPAFSDRIAELMNDCLSV